MQNKCFQKQWRKRKAMREKGIVISEAEKTIEVEILRSGLCGENCVGCGACGGKKHVVSANNLVDAHVGDEVVLEMTSSRLFAAAFLVYIIPLIAVFLGYYAAGCFCENDVFCAGCGFLFMIIGFFCIHVYDRKNHDKYKSDAVLKVTSSQNGLK